MTDQERRRFTFVSRALEEDTFEVVRFRGVEGISKLYEFDITLVSEDPEIDLRAVLQNPATLTIIRDDGDDRLIHGIPAQFEQLREEDEHIFYRAVLVPRLWQADLYRENQLFLEKTVPDVIEEILDQTGLTTDDYELNLTGQYPEWEYICQYGETDFDFISRWMEREGIYYYFEQTEEFEKLVITDNSSRHEDIVGTSTIEYHPPSSLRAREEEVVRELICRQKMLPRKVILRDYNYRRPDLELRAEADVDTEGRGEVYSYGEHFKTTEEGNALAGIRAEEILCRGTIFCGESTVLNLCPGFLFELAEHYRDSYNQRLLITELEHEGNQAGAIFGVDQTVGEEQPQLVYFNRLVCIPADVQYRPERTTPRPRFYGTMNARVDATGDGQYAEIDDEGRYKVKLCFDQSGNKDGKASRWIRMAQPYAGPEYGMHFPLHKGTEVLLTFVDGDLDRPIISGSVPNPETKTPVTGKNQTQSVIRTGGGNQIAIEDSDGGQQIHLSSPTQDSKISIGAPNEGNIFMNTLGDFVAKVHGPEKRLTNGDVYVKHGAKYKYECSGSAIITYKDNVHQKTVGNTIEEFQGTKQSKCYAATDELFVGIKTSKNLSVSFEETVGLKSTKNLAATDELFIGVKSSRCAALSKEAFAGLKISLAAGASIEKSAVKNLSEAPINEIKGTGGVKITCGGSSIEMTPGSIKIDSPSILVSSSGGMVRMNGDVTVGGRTAFTDNVSMDQKLKVNGKLDHPSITAS